jgi:GT2 family glycosyltransferase
VSAIVVTHDSPPGALLAACGSFAAAFTGVERETIVADNGSRVPFFPAGAFAVRIGGNLGFGAACNRAAAVARAPVLLFLNPDARLAAGRWEAILERFEADPLLGAVGVLRREPDGGEAPEVVPPAMTPRQVCRDLLFAGGGRRRRPPVEGGGFQPVAWLPASCLFVRARLFVELGGFDELFFLYFEDVDLCERIRRTGYTVAFTPAAEAVHPEGGHEKYHDRARLGHYYAGLAAYLAKWHSRSAPLLAGVILLRLASRAAFWSVARLLGRIDRTAWSERMAGYAAAARAVLRSRPRAKEETA